MAVETPVQPQPAEELWLPLHGQWTYEDYKRLPDDAWRYEVIEGELFMSPAPRPRHQEVGFNLKLALGGFVKARGLGTVLDAPIDVRLGDLADPVQPDILFIRHDRLSIIKDGWIEGAPDLIVEILSPGNWLDDRRTKYLVYARAGVGEYWIVDPDRRQIEAFVSRRGVYELTGRFGPGEQARSEVLSGFQIAVDEVCPI